MPDRYRAIGDAIEEQRRMVVDLTDLHRARRRQIVYNWLLGIALSLTVIGGVVIAFLVVENRDARIDLCRSQNTAQRAAREDLDRVLTATANASPPAGDLIDRIRTQLSTPEQVDEDCNQSGELDPGDYNRINERRQ